MATAYKLTGTIEGKTVEGTYPTLQKAKREATRLLFDNNLIAHVEQWIEDEPEAKKFTLVSKKVPVHLEIAKVDA